MTTCTQPDRRLTPAQQALAGRWAGLPAHVAERFRLQRRRAGFDFDEAVGVGLVALVEAARLWQPGRAPFGAFAAMRVRQRIAEALGREIRRPHLCTLPDDRDPADHRPDPALDVDARDQLRVLLRRARLTRGERAAVRAVYGLGRRRGGKPLRAAALELHMSRTAVLRRLGSALAKLRDAAGSSVV